MPLRHCHCIFSISRLLVTVAAVWTAELAAAQPFSLAADNSTTLQRGQRLLTQYQCGSCHAIPGIAAARGLQGPTLEAFGRRSYIAGRIPNRADNLVRWIVQPSTLVPDTTMPAMGVSLEQARNMAAYLGSLK
jgi:cytochrome c